MPRKSNDIGIFEDLGGHVRIGRRQGNREVADGLALAFMEPGFNLDGQHIFAHAKLQSLLGIPEPEFRVAELIQEGQIAAPKQLCNGALHN